MICIIRKRLANIEAMISVHSATSITLAALVVADFEFERSFSVVNVNGVIKPCTLRQQSATSLGSCD